MSAYFLKHKKEEISFEEILLDEHHSGEMPMDMFLDGVKLKKLQIIILILILLLWGRLFVLQVIKGNSYLAMSEKNYTRNVTVRASRGIIYDKNMKQIVFNVPTFDVVLIPADFMRDRKVDTHTKLATLVKILEIESEEAQQLVTKITNNYYSYQPLLIKGGMEKERALIIEEKIKGMAGVRLESGVFRKYIDGQYLSAVIGYSGRINQKELEIDSSYLVTDTIGKEGVELYYEKTLRGLYGKQVVEVDSSGRFSRLVHQQDPVPGHNLLLNIDAQLQQKIYQELENIILKNPKSTGGSVVAIDPRDGSVLALVNYPYYDNNLFAGGISSNNYNALLNDERRPLFNRAIAGEYPPGSTFKPLVAAAALEEKVINPQRKIYDSGSINVGRWVFVDWKPHGEVDLVKAIAQSCSVYFYTIGGGYGDIQGLGADRIKQYAQLFGLGQLTRIDLPGEKSGLIPGPEWKQEVKREAWYIGDTYHMSIGQGDVLSTPLQIANYTAAIANGGVLYKPRILDKVLNVNGEIVTENLPEVLEQNFIDKKNMTWIQKGMRENVLSGSGMAISVLGVSSAGKTGTAQYANNQKSHAWYTVYAPYEKPEIAMAIIIEGGGEGHLAAVPVAKEVLSWYFDKQKDSN